MNLLLNASNLRHGGGKTVALQLINGIAPLRPEDKIFVLAPRTPEFEALAKHPNVTVLPVSDSFHRSWPVKWFQMHYVFPGKCRKLKIDKVISLGNAAFPSGKRPQLVYIQLPQLVYHESQAWKQMAFGAFLRNSLMDSYVAMHLRYASSYAVQTDVMKHRLIARFKLPDERVYVLPNAPVEEDESHPTPVPMSLQPLKLLFLSRYYPHKNFECLPRVAELLESRGIPVQITITISKDEAKGAAEILEALRGHPSIVNIGPVALPEIAKVMKTHHGVFLPSLMESFSGVYSEALLHRRHIFTSHYDFATELLGDAAFYFDPLRPEHIVTVLEEVINKPAVLSRKLRTIERAALIAPRISGVSKLFSRIIDTFA